MSTYRHDELLQAMQPYKVREASDSCTFCPAVQHCEWQLSSKPPAITCSDANVPGIQVAWLCISNALHCCIQGLVVLQAIIDVNTSKRPASV